MQTRRRGRIGRKGLMMPKPESDLKSKSRYPLLDYCGTELPSMSGFRTDYLQSPHASLTITATSG